tara:strand:+ start:4134 stop:4469 length:336 start_codon:yes stop_codon:yes gene_type:complete
MQGGLTLARRNPLTNYGDGRNKGGRMQESAVRPATYQRKRLQVFHHPKGRQRIERSEKTLPLENNTQVNPELSLKKQEDIGQRDARPRRKNIRIQQRRYAEIQARQKEENG